MSLTIKEKVTTERHSDGPRYYVITVPTWVTDREAAVNLAVQVAESLAVNDQVDTNFTTVGIEEEPLSEHERIYAECVGSTPSRE